MRESNLSRQRAKSLANRAGQRSVWRTAQASLELDRRSFQHPLVSPMKLPTIFQPRELEASNTSKWAGWRSERSMETSPTDGLEQEYECRKSRAANGAPLRHVMQRASQSPELPRVTAAPLRRFITFSKEPGREQPTISSSR